MSSAAKLRRLLVANRGEIAVRIIRAARDHGLETVAVYSDPDAGAAHVRMADKAVRLPGAASRDTYLRIPAIVAAAIETGADSVHPGYGFLGENAEFAAAVRTAGLRFIGPQPEVMAAMGDKHQARELARAAGVPLLPGTVPGASLEEIHELIRTVGFPVIIKAVAGGSGRGMRVVHGEAELEPLMAEASSEAESAFGNPSVYLERYLTQPRHIEIQVLGDKLGTVVAFGERECSLQRRHQKLVEEAPAPNLDARLSERIQEAALALCRAVRYESAGTLEFLVDGGTQPESPFYFLEMNTRIQVEHPVTEEVFDVDLVKLQLAVEDGLDLSTMKPRRAERHSIELRIYAEDPAQDFKPASGTISYMSRPGGPGIREDSWVEAGTRISAFYDTLLTKLIVTAPSRAEAVYRARRALAELIIEGVPTTLDFHRWLVEQHDFIAGNVDIQWIGRCYEGGARPPKHVGPLVLPPPRA